MSKKSGSKLRCSRCGAPADGKFPRTQELVCNKCMYAYGVCTSCGKKFRFRIDKKLMQVGDNKICKECDLYWERGIVTKFRSKTFLK